MIVSGEWQRDSATWLLLFKCLVLLSLIAFIAHDTFLVLGAVPEDSDFTHRGFWKLCFSFIPLRGVPAWLTEARRGGPEKESVLPDHSACVASCCWPSAEAPTIISDRPDSGFSSPPCHQQMPTPSTLNSSCALSLENSEFQGQLLTLYLGLLTETQSVKRGKAYQHGCCCLPENSLECLASTRPDSQLGTYVEEVGLLP